MAGRSNLTCAVCRHEVADAVVCHHCGKPLCSSCRQKWPDTGFAAGGRLPRAFHCGGCLNHYHMSGRDLLLVVARESGLGTGTAQKALQQARRR